MSTRASTSRKPSSRTPHAPDDYLDLVREFPLRPLKSDAEHKSAGAILDRLVGREDLTPGQLDYVAALARFVEDYEQSKTRALAATLSPVDLLRHLMEEHDLNTSDLGYIVGSRGLASEILSGKRGLSKMVIARLAERFNLDPGALLER